MYKIKTIYCTWLIICFGFTSFCQNNLDCFVTLDPPANLEYEKFGGRVLLNDDFFISIENEYEVLIYKKESNNWNLFQTLTYSISPRFAFFEDNKLIILYQNSDLVNIDYYHLIENNWILSSKSFTTSLNSASLNSADYQNNTLFISIGGEIRIFEESVNSFNYSQTITSPVPSSLGLNGDLFSFDDLLVASIQTFSLDTNLKIYKAFFYKKKGISWELVHEVERNYSFKLFGNSSILLLHDYRNGEQFIYDIQSEIPFLLEVGNLEIITITDKYVVKRLDTGEFELYKIEGNFSLQYIKTYIVDTPSARFSNAAISGNSLALGFPCPLPHLIENLISKQRNLMPECGFANIYELNCQFEEINFCLTDAQGSLNSTITVPIQITNFENISSFQFQLKIEDASVVTIKNVKDAALSGAVFFQNADDTYSIAWFDPNGVGVTLADNSVIFELEIELTGNNNDCTDIDFSEPKTFQNGQEITTNTKKGEVCITASLIKSGIIANFKGFPIPNVSVDCNGMEQVSTSTDGFYEFTNIAGGNNYTITPSKELECKKACFNIADYAAIRRHIAGTVPLTNPYEFIAADVSRDGIINDSDLELISQMIGFAFPEIDRFPAGAWKFVPKDYTFPNQTNPFNPVYPEEIELSNLQADALNQDFVAIKVGDAAITNTAGYRTNQSLTFEVTKTNTNKGDRFDFYSFNLHEVTSFQVSLGLNNQLLIPPNLIPGQLENISFFKSTTNNIQLVWFNLDPNKEIVINSNRPIFSVLIPEVNKRNNKIEINQELTTTLAFDSENNDFPILLKERTEDNNRNELMLLPNTPNPFRHTTKLRFYLPKRNQVALSIFDYSGQEIYTINKYFEKGYQEITLEDVLPRANGIYVYQIKTNKTSQFGKMIRL